MEYLESLKQDNVRPISFESYIGQEKIKKNLKLAIAGSKKRGHQLDHILFYGPPGLGKTTLSTIISHEIKGNIKIVTGTSIEKAGDIAALLMGLEDGDLLFIDEIHRIPKIAEEAIYSAMEDFQLHIQIGDGDTSNTIVVDLPKFTLIGATTRAGMLTKPLRDRFGMNFKLQYYSENELKNVLINASDKLEIKLDDDAALEIGQRSRKTPRVALKLLKRIRDFADFEESHINIKIVKDSLSEMNVFKYGLDENDVKYLRILKESKQKVSPYGYKAVALKTMASKMSEDVMTIEDTIEPFLISMNFIEKTGQGRILSTKSVDLDDLY